MGIDREKRALAAEAYEAVLSRDPHPMEDERWIFVHVPKCAGTTVRNMLTGPVGYKKGVGMAVRVRGHCRIYDYANFRKIGSFAIKRNPYDRAISIFCWVYRKEKFDGDEVVKAFRRWTDHLHEPSNDEKDFKVSHPSDTIYLSYPQKTWLCFAGSSEILVSHVLSFENLAEDWRRFSDLAFGCEIPLEHANSSPRRSVPGVRSWYDELSIRNVAEHYASDFEILGYDPSKVPD